MFKFFRRFIRNRQMRLIYKLGYQYFFDTFEPDINGVHIPPFLQQGKREEYARERTNECIEQIIKNNALNQCYKSARKYERKLIANKLRLQVKRLLNV